MTWEGVRAALATAWGKVSEAASEKGPPAS